VAIVYSDRVKEQTTTSGIGTLSLSGAFSGFQSFGTGVGVGNECYYTIVDDTTNEWEVGTGTVGISTLSRDTVLDSSNAGSLVNFSPGTKTVFAVAPAQFFATALTTAVHAGIDHQTVSGVPAPESFDATDHQSVNHTAVPFSLLNASVHASIDHQAGVTGVPAPEAFTSTAHNGVDHRIGPFNLLDAAAHAAIDHQVGVTGVYPPTRSYIIEFATLLFPTGPDTIPFFWRPSFIGTGAVAGRWPVPRAGRVTAGVLDNTSGTATVNVRVNGVAVFSFLATGVGTVAPVTWTPFSVVAGDYIEVESTGAGTHEASLVMFVEP
jgi:hypothetical protein